MHNDMTEKVEELAEALGIRPDPELRWNELSDEDARDGLAFPDPFEDERIRAAFEKYINNSSPLVKVDGIAYKPYDVLALCRGAESQANHHDEQFMRWHTLCQNEGTIVRVRWNDVVANEYRAIEVQDWIERAQRVLEARQDPDDTPRCSCGRYADPRYVGIPSCAGCYANAQEEKWNRA